ncbi:MAG: hypothetical protein AAF515_15270 [Pseudomonadota bacterium]
MPPRALSFLPAREDIDLSVPPVWTAHRDSRWVLMGGALLLALIGFVMGTIAGSTGLFEPVVILLVFMLVTLTAARWPGMRRFPVLGELSRWNHRLRLFYFTTDPGSIWRLAARPIVGLFVAPWLKTARAEVRLYLQIGVFFALVFALADLHQVYETGIWKGVGLVAAELAQTVVYTYVFVAPVGAVLLTQQLLARRDCVVVGLCVLNLSCGYVGLRLVDFS